MAIDYPSSTTEQDNTDACSLIVEPPASRYEHDATVLILSISPCTMVISNSSGIPFPRCPSPFHTHRGLPSPTSPAISAVERQLPQPLTNDNALESLPNPLSFPNNFQSQAQTGGLGLDFEGSFPLGESQVGFILQDLAILPSIPGYNVGPTFSAGSAAFRDGLALELEYQFRINRSGSSDGHAPGTPPKTPVSNGDAQDDGLGNSQDVSQSTNAGVDTTIINKRGK